jgi:hypothetical protein
MKPAKWMGHGASISGPDQSMLSCLPTHFAMKPAKWMGHSASISGPDQSMLVMPSHPFRDETCEMDGARCFYFRAGSIAGIGDGRSFILPQFDSGS